MIRSKTLERSFYLKFSGFILPCDKNAKKIFIFKYHFALVGATGDKNWRMALLKSYNRNIFKFARSIIWKGF